VAGLGIQELLGEGHTHIDTDSMVISKAYFNFFKKRNSFIYSLFNNAISSCSDYTASNGRMNSEGMWLQSKLRY
jgi:hypothetical protein